MSKLQKLHDYLLETRLIESDQLEVWETNSKTFAGNTLDATHKMSKRREYQANILISNLTPAQDRDQIEFALIWWLNLYEPDHDLNQPRLLTDPDIADARVTDLWIGCKLTEKVWLEAGQVKRCFRPLVMDAAVVQNVPVWLEDVVTGEEFQLWSPE